MNTHRTEVAGPGEVPCAAPPAPYLLLTLTTTGGRTGRQFITGASDAAAMVWDKDGDDPTDVATFEYFSAEDVEQPADFGELDGDTWRVLESDGLPMTTVLRWLSHPQFIGSLSGCLTAALHCFDPDGWTDAHERVLELSAEVASLRTSLNRSRDLARLMSSVLDRLANGEDFNRVVEQTAITARVTATLRDEE